MRFVLDHYNYWACIALMLVGFYGVMAKSNMVKKAISLGLFQTGILVFYITIGKVAGGTAPVNTAMDAPYTNPLPHALMLTAIVVGVATLAVALAIIVNIREAFGTIDEYEIHRIEHEQPD